MYIDNGVVKIFLQKMIFTYSISSFKCPSSLFFFSLLLSSYSSSVSQKSSLSGGKKKGNSTTFLFLDGNKYKLGENVTSLSLFKPSVTPYGGQK